MKTAFLYSIDKRWMFFLGMVFILVMNYLSTAIPFGGMTNADVSQKYPTLITPAGYAFSIWGVIYLTLIVFSVFQLKRGREVRFYKMIWPLFMVNALANGFWLLAFQNEWLGVSVLLMAILLGTLIAMFKLFYRFKNALSTTHRYFFHVPFGIYFGWVSVASIVNVSVFLTAMDIPLFMDSQPLWSLVMLCIGFVLAMLILLTQKDYIYALTFVWAYTAIMVAHREVDLVRYAAKFASLGLLAACAVLFVTDRIQIARYGQSSQ